MELNSEFVTQSENLKNKFKFERVDTVSQTLEYTVKGDVITIWPIGYQNPLRIEFFGDECDKIYSVDTDYFRKMYDFEYIVLSENIPQDKLDIQSITLEINNPKSVELNKYIFTNKTPAEIYEKTDFQYPQLFYSRLDLLELEIKRLETSGYDVLINTASIEDLPLELHKYINPEKFEKKYKFNFHNILPAGGISENLKLALFSDRELYGTIFLNKNIKNKAAASNIKKLLRQFEGNISTGDYVVHEDFGIGIYDGLKLEKFEEEPMEYLHIKYDGDDDLYIPLTQIEKITKYLGSAGLKPKLSSLSKPTWETVKKKIKKSTGLLAKELLEHYAKRELAKAITFPAQDSDGYKKFCDEFEFIETEDQLRCVNEILNDLTKQTPMNRLLVGDVGFGKTEVFLRAIYKVVENGYQVAILSPTTVLAAQHENVIKDRFKNTKFTVGSLSRFNSRQQNNKVVDDLNEGKLNIVVGTHRLLSNDIKFKKLALVIVDEEQKFGVKQKEKIKNLNYTTHLLSVSATPIPRTLSMALSTIHEISIITQPPLNRKPIKTEIIKDNWEKVSKAIEFEIERGGQVFFIHNEVMTIEQIKIKLERLNPGIRFAVAHGQMKSEKLDEIITEFYEKRYDCLISTTIIENGVDIPNVNTIIVHKSQKFGLSQLYQLRGRVGRSDIQAYCYLMYEGKAFNSQDQQKERVEEKKYVQRLQTLVENQELGSGFRIASRDLEIRGAGNILGEQQSGHISTIGYALYIEILAQEVERLRH